MMEGPSQEGRGPSMFREVLAAQENLREQAGQLAERVEQLVRDQVGYQRDPPPPKGVLTETAANQQPWAMQIADLQRGVEHYHDRIACALDHLRSHMP